VTLKIEEMIAEGDTVVYRWTVHGRHTHEMLTPYGPAAPTGREITLTGISITHLRDGKIVEEILHGDDLGYCQQMGVIPTPGKST
jgi:predicted ester cyclase